MTERNVRNRKAWAEQYPNEDSYGSAFVGWIVSHGELFGDDHRIASVSDLALSRGWKAVLGIARAVWKEHDGVTFESVRRRISKEKKASLDTQKHLVELVGWAEEVSENLTEDDYTEIADQIWQKTRRLHFASGMGSIIEKIGHGDQHLDAGVEELYVLCDGIRRMGQSGNAGTATMMELGARIHDNFDKSLGIPIGTEFYRLDQATLGGHRKGHLWLLCGYTSQGKTYLAREISFRMAMRGFRVVWCSLEMGLDDMPEYFVGRMVHEIRAGGVDIGPAMQRTLHDHDKEVYLEAAKRWADPASECGNNVQLWVPDTDVTSQDIAQYAETEHRKRPIDLLVVDYSELIQATNMRDDYRIRLGESIRVMKLIAKHLGRGDGTRVLLLHQTSRKGFDKAINRGYYVKQDMAETSHAEKHADVIAWILRDEDMERDNEAKIGTAKNRIGSMQLAYGYKVYADYTTGYIGDLAAGGQ